MEHGQEEERTKIKKERGEGTVCGNNGDLLLRCDGADGFVRLVRA